MDPTPDKPPAGPPTAPASPPPASYRGTLAAAASLLLLLSVGATAARAAKVSGVVVDADTGQPVRGAQVAVAGSDVTATTDLDGLVLLELPDGSYTVEVRGPGYAPQRIQGVTAGGEGDGFAAALERSDATSGEGADDARFTAAITVTAESDVATEAALLAERRSAAQISDSIGSLEMSKNTGSDAAASLKRVTGISLQDDKYVYVRGLGDRYSNTTVNGSRLPSTEFEKKVVPLDLFPSSLIEKITVSKSYTVDKPGDFAAGLVELVTTEFPSRATASVSFGAGYGSETTGESTFQYPGGLGFAGGGGQPLPSSVPAEDLVPFSRITGEGFSDEELEAIGESIGGGWTPGRQEAGLDTGFSLSYGNSWDKLGFVASYSYDDDHKREIQEQHTYSNSNAGLVPNNSFVLDFGEEKVRQAYTGNLSYRFAPNHHVQLRGVVTDLSTGEGRTQEGFYSDIDTDIRDFRVSYKQQEITSFYLSGDHFWSGLGDGGLLEWRATTSEATTDENKRETLYTETSQGFILSDLAQSGFLYYNDLDDQIDDYALDWTSFFSFGEAVASVKVGAARTDSERTFDGRRLRFAHPRSVIGDLGQSPEELFSPELIGPDGFEIQEITRPTDSYLGHHEIDGGYVQGDFTFGRWRLIGGVRYEDSRQEVVTFDRNNPDNPPIVTLLDDADLLPSLSLVYQLTPSQNLRASGSQTVNRPEYRELAPFTFTHVTGGFATAGNPDLVQATIRSFDVRWEWFPSAREVVAASLFYKEFDDPIEGVLFAGAELTQSFLNADSAENLGLELEMRRNLGAWGETLDDWNLIFNYAYVDSQVTLPPGTPLTLDERALVGQPESVWNGIVEWDRDADWGTVVRVLYNFTDDKVAQAGAFGLPDVLEASYATLDLVVAQSLGAWAPGLSVKLTGSNLLDEERLWTQGGLPWLRYSPGTSVGLSFSFDPFRRRGAAPPVALP